MRKRNATRERIAELNSLKELRVYIEVDRSEADGHRLYSSVFVDKVKQNGEKRSRFCVAAFNDEHQLFTTAPTVKRSSLRVLIELCVKYDLKVPTRDI